MKTKENRCRICIYILGLIILALGLTLNTKAGLGVSPIISIAYAASELTGYNFGNTTFAEYSVFVVIEIVLLCIRWRKQKKAQDEALQNAKKADSRMILLMDVLQLPLSLVFTRFLNLFSKLIPNVQTDGKSVAAALGIKLAVLALALILTGIGAALSLNMRIVPNPGDGIVQAISDFIHKSVGFTKNCIDITCVITTVVVCLLCGGKIYGVGIGTIIAMVAVGRTIAVFNHFTKKKLMQVTGLEES